MGRFRVCGARISSAGIVVAGSAFRRAAHFRMARIPAASTRELAQFANRDPPIEIATLAHRWRGGLDT